MKICFIVPEFYPDIGGIANATLDFSEALAKRGHEVAVVAMTKDKRLAEQEKHGSVAVHRVLCKNIAGIGGSLLLFAKRAPAAVAALDPDVVYGQTIFPSGVVSARFRDKITVCHGRGTDVTHTLSMKKYYLLNMYALKNNKFLLAKNREDARKMKDFCGRTVRVFPTGITAPKVKGSRAQWRSRLGMDAKKFHVLYVGRAAHFKGLDYLREAVERIENCELHVIGSGIQLPREYVYGYMKACDVFAYPELVGQGMSNAVLEAMALGMPVVGANVGFFRELVANGKDGILVEPGSAPALRAALEEMKDDKALRKRLGAEAQRKIRKHHTMEKMVKAFEELVAR